MNSIQNELWVEVTDNMVSIGIPYNMMSDKIYDAVRPAIGSAVRTTVEAALDEAAKEHV